MAQPATPPPEPASVIRSKQFVVLLVLAAIVGGRIARCVGFPGAHLLHPGLGVVYTDLPQEVGTTRRPSGGLHRFSRSRG